MPSSDVIVDGSNVSPLIRNETRYECMRYCLTVFAGEMQEQCDCHAKRNSCQHKQWCDCKSKQREASSHDKPRDSGVHLHYPPLAGMWLLVITHVLILALFWARASCLIGNCRNSQRNNIGCHFPCPRSREDFTIAACSGKGNLCVKSASKIFERMSCLR
jgi:hypothetical protein